MNLCLIIVITSYSLLFLFLFLSPAGLPARRETEAGCLVYARPFHQPVAGEGPVLWSRGNYRTL